nr:receptor-like protein kinase FERONIA [Coffea arabica]
MYLEPILLVTFSSHILLGFSHHRFIASVQGYSTPGPAAPYYVGDDIAINCGSVGNSAALDGREWIGEAASQFLSGKSRTSTALDKSFYADPIPYMISRISATPFHYTFQVSPGQKIIRLHFYPASYRGFENSFDLFSVKAGLFTLLEDFSPSLTADGSGEKYIIVKEFCLNVEENKKLSISFSPSFITESKDNPYAFVNGIEIISMAAGLYYTPDGDLGAPIVGQKNRFYSVDNTTALEMIKRLNIGGSFISSVEDFGMFRRWDEDSNFLLESRVYRMNHPVLSIKHPNMPPFVAPLKLYQTSWKAGGKLKVDQTYNFTWKLPIYMGFGYLVRFHFCVLDAGMADKEQSEFTILINDQMAETQADVIKWSGGTGTPVYRDYVVIMKGDREGSKCDLLISLQSPDELVLGLLNGVEVFKLSNLKNSLATPNPAIPKRVSAASSLKIHSTFLAFGRSNNVVTGLTIVIILVDVIVYRFRQIWEEKFHLYKRRKDIVAATTEPSFTRFSLAEIMSATQNFSDALIIGKGGFGKVYKGCIQGISQLVAIKRFKSSSKQGAQEFWAEIEILSKHRHIHLVSLIGYCNEAQEMILVYEYMVHGTLADNLYKVGNKVKDRAPLDWKKRLRICIGAARGLEYLHTSSEEGIIHRDVKDSNILLDENFVAKIADLGLSRLESIPLSKSYISTNVKGTLGYLDPDYCTTHRVTRKSDVFSFGIVLLVVLSGRRAISTGTPEEHRSLLSFFRECIEGGELDKIIDPSLQGKIPSNSLKEFVKCVENCLKYNPKKRPSMTQVVANLEYALEQQESPIFSPMFSVSGVETAGGQLFEKGATESFQLSQHEEPPILEESVISRPNEVTTSKPLQKTASTSNGKDLQSSKKDSSLIRRPSKGWLWKAGWNIGKQTKRTHFILPNVSGPRFSLKDIQAAMDISVDHHHFIIDGELRKVYIGHMKQHPELAFSIYQLPIGRRHKEVLDVCTHEIERLSRLRHPNLLSLIGYCHDKLQDQILLIYDHIGFATLQSYLYGSKTTNHLQWKNRLQIGIGVAQGLDYLHKGTRSTIVHHDVRLENILLNEDLRPKILNSGLSKLSPVAHLEKAPSKSELPWLEYLSPEVITSGLQASEKSDVYSFGLVLLELLCCQKTKDFHLCVGNDERYLKHWVKNHIKTKTLDEIIDPSVEWEIASACLAEFLKIAFNCLRVRKAERPSMSFAIEKLKFALQLQEKAETRFQDYKGQGLDSRFNLEDIYQDTPYLAYD